MSCLAFYLSSSLACYMAFLSSILLMTLYLTLCHILSDTLTCWCLIWRCTPDTQCLGRPREPSRACGLGWNVTERPIWPGHHRAMSGRQRHHLSFAPAGCCFSIMTPIGFRLEPAKLMWNWYNHLSIYIYIVVYTYMCPKRILIYLIITVTVIIIIYHYHHHCCYYSCYCH